MLPARRYRNRFICAELSLAILLGVTSANAQTSGATRAQTGVTPKPAATAAQTAPTSATATAASTGPGSAPTPPSPAAQTAAPASAVAPSSTPTAPTAAAPAEQPTSPNEPEVSVAPLAPHALNASAESDAELSSLDMRSEPLGKPPESARWLLIGTGIGTSALWYAGAFGIRELWPSHSGRSDLKIPIAGPFMDLAHTGCPASNPGCSTFQLVMRTLLVTLDAIGQAGGVALVLQGAVLGTASVESPRSNRAATLRHTARPTQVVPVPWLDANGGGGIGLVGRF